MIFSERLARGLASVFLGGEWKPDALLARTKALLGRSTIASQRGLIKELLIQFPRVPPPARSLLVQYLLDSRRLNRISKSTLAWEALLRSEAAAPSFSPIPRFESLSIPKLTSPADLATWLKISVGQLDWLADTRRQHRLATRAALLNYDYRLVPRKSGTPRLIEAPKPKLMAIQRRILREILDKIPVHPCAHGFVAGRSCLSSAQVHASEIVVATIDLKDFFNSTPVSRVFGIFRSIGYPWRVASLLTGLCGTTTPRSVIEGASQLSASDWRTRKLLESPHLPQGAPTSPALANLVARKLDARLLGLARSCDANYTRYADDISFSGGEGFAHTVHGFLAVVEKIAKDEGYALNHRKSRIMRRGGPQKVTGLVVNDHLNIPRIQYDQLKATLHNCIKRGPKEENRSGTRDFRSHLDGRVNWVENVNFARGQRLRSLFNQIRW